MEPIVEVAQDDITAGIPETVIWAGMAAWDTANHDMERYVPGVTPDWDEGMIVCAIYKAMIAATPPAPKADNAALKPWSEEEAAEHLRLLYNHADNDSRQFTREQMYVAMHHGRRAACMSCGSRGGEGGWSRTELARRFVGVYRILMTQIRLRSRR